MPNWDSVLKEINNEQTNSNDSAHDRVRRRYLKKLFRRTGRNVIAYYSGFLSKSRIEGVEINDDDKNGFMLCVHNLDRSKGLDLILHTPGGDGQAAISIVDYLRSMFGKDMRAIVPQIAMSAGTMVASSCKEILMGKHSSLGPVDPQFGVIAAANFLAEIKKAKEEILSNPHAALFWNPILSKITPSFVERCEWAIKDSNEFIESTLRSNMLSNLNETEQNEKIKSISEVFANNEGRAHNTHIQFDDCIKSGLSVSRIEDDPVLQDLVLTIHHCYMHTLSNTPAFKLIENHLGRAHVRLQQQVLMMQGVPSSLASGGPA